MPINTDEEDEFSKWEESFRADARLDRSRALKDHMRRLGLPGDPQLLIDGTVDFVRASVAYLRLDNQGIKNFLARQTYEVSRDPHAFYVLTFDVIGRAYGRLVVSSSFEFVDLADLFNHPWYRLNLAGYSMFWVSRIDGQGLSNDDRKQIKHNVECDLRFDYLEDELTILYEDDATSGALCVALQE